MPISSANPTCIQFACTFGHLYGRMAHKKADFLAFLYLPLFIFGGHKWRETQEDDMH